MKFSLLMQAGRKRKQRLQAERPTVAAALFNLRPQLTGTSTGLWAISTRSRKKTRKRRPCARKSRNYAIRWCSSIVSSHPTRSRLPCWRNPTSSPPNTPQGKNSAARETSDRAPEKADGKADIVPIGQVSVPVVSSLSQPMSDERILAGLSESRNWGFVTPVGTGGAAEKNTIRICVHGDQTVLNGQRCGSACWNRCVRETPCCPATPS